MAPIKSIYSTINIIIFAVFDIPWSSISIIWELVLIHKYFILYKQIIISLIYVAIILYFIINSFNKRIHGLNTIFVISALLVNLSDSSGGESDNIPKKYFLFLAIKKPGWLCSHYQATKWYWYATARTVSCVVLFEPISKL